MVFLDWSLSRTEAVRRLNQHLKKNCLPFSLPIPNYFTLKQQNLDLAWYFLLEPGLEKPRYLVQPGFLGHIPAQSDSGLKRWLSQKGGFYLQPRHKMMVLARTPAGAIGGGLVAQVVGEIIENRELPAIKAAIRQVYISTTNVLLLQAQSGEQQVFVRFPFTRLSLQRVQQQVALTSLLAAQGIPTVPRPLPLSRQSVPVFAEVGLPGRNMEKQFEGADTATARRLFSAALDHIREIHQKFGQVVTLNPQLFETHCQQRLEAIAGRVAAVPAGLARIANYLRETLIGKQILLSVCHGDFKIGNCLFDPEGRLSGLIDWDMGEREAPALIDVVSLLAKSLRQRHGISLGELPLRASDLPPEFDEIYRQYFQQTGTSEVPVLPAILFYWLDRVYKQVTFDPHLKTQWITRNVSPVLENMDAILA